MTPTLTPERGPRRAPDRDLSVATSKWVTETRGDTPRRSQRRRMAYSTGIPSSTWATGSKAAASKPGRAATAPDSPRGRRRRQINSGQVGTHRTKLGTAPRANDLQRPAPRGWPGGRHTRRSLDNNPGSSHSDRPARPGAGGNVAPGATKSSPLWRNRLRNARPAAWLASVGVKDHGASV